MNFAVPVLASGIGMIVVAVAAVCFWRRTSQASPRWFWIGAGLWTVAVLVKLIIGFLTNPSVIRTLRNTLSFGPYIASGGLYLGIESSICEIGLTFLAGMRWKELGRASGRAIAVGVGAGAFEALLLGLVAVAGIAAYLAGMPGTEEVGEQIRKTAATTPLYWLLGPAERITAIICHAASRALVLLGAQYGEGRLIALGFLIFTLLDGVAGAVLLSGKMNMVSLWWIELAFAIIALASIPVLRWLHVRYGEKMMGQDRGRENDQSRSG